MSQGMTIKGKTTGDINLPVLVDGAGRVQIGGDVNVMNPAPLLPGTDYDYIDSQQTSATVETYVYKLGGSGGNDTIVMSKATVADPVAYTSDQVINATIQMSTASANAQVNMWTAILDISKPA